VLEKILTCKCCHRITRMKEEGISNIYIDDLMKKISCSFRGTFSIDKIPTFKDEKFSIIVNLSKENEKGTHFIGIMSSKDTIIYFDSYGIEHINLTIEKYLKKYRKKILHSNVQLQHVFSSHCGYFCVSFILCLENNIPLHKFLTIFHKKDLYLNDYICIQIITTFIKSMYLRN